MKIHAFMAGVKFRHEVQFHYLYAPKSRGLHVWLLKTWLVASRMNSIHFVCNTSFWLWAWSLAEGFYSLYFINLVVLYFTIYWRFCYREYQARQSQKSRLEDTTGYLFDCEYAYILHIYILEFVRLFFFYPFFVSIDICRYRLKYS